MLANMLHHNGDYKFSVNLKIRFSFFRDVLSVKCKRLNMQAWHASDALRIACDKGNFWITNRAHKLKTLRKGYSRIKPTMLPKGLSTFKKEHCDGFENNQERARFLRCLPKIYSIDVEDNRQELSENRENCSRSPVVNGRHLHEDFPVLLPN